ncbi:tRNA1(Val) A37 N6-methylase TrmN6 [Yoonia sediminilitoris]|uniref:tRNA1(Val) A37 N6-methylase TrmN6 n=1 Tax=Yoonia sediminilitoris TaxID=1286148 RepID=A0A2T6KIN4_9RHOB|nr:methyltransferase [Yoonia sediminilitoris]PUB15589.1 tRNA1(Val) A37 N6-methylase TrmN6 [Yoonia sediminilitoris]RCW96198.1 tRNA1(Val) A37 N6-methylase TrmN6 [Yoonia sediminilitoris]
MDGTDDLTCDDFLGGRLRIWQPRKGYRAGVDPVLLGASIAAKPGQSVLELGCGVGVASLCLAARVPGVSVTGVEVQPHYADLARRNARENSAAFHVITADLRALPHEVRQQRFDHVIMNPPYFDRLAGTASDDGGRDIALGGGTPLTDWLDIGARRVGPKGYLTIIQRIARLPEVLSALEGRLGSIVVLPISGRERRAPELFLLRARQEGRAAFSLLSPLTMHAGERHTGDKDNYLPEINDILRNGAGLPIAP